MNAPKPSELFRQPMIVNAPEMDVAPAHDVQSDESTWAKQLDYQLGNVELPIAQYREKIVTAVRESQATIITAETGAGKSTQVPQFLAEAGFEVIVTQPRVVAARSVAERVRNEVVVTKGQEYENYVGYRTSKERGDDEANQILFVTDGLQQVRELSGHGIGKKQVLVLDEVHEWNENMEVLVAWAKKRMGEDPNFKVVVMSATMEAGPLAMYFADDGTRTVPVNEVPGRTYEVKKEEGGDVVDQAVRFANEGKNTLVFAPGEAEIKEIIASIKRANIPGATILPLYGRLDPSEQNKVFAQYPGVKIIVATNVAQTSLTIPDIAAVVDSGLERRKEVRNGVEGLYLVPISQADCMQRAGRAGRTKAGEYVLAQLGSNDFVPLNERDPYSTPEILRTRLDGMVLRLAKNDFDASELEFYNVTRRGDEERVKFEGEVVAAKSRLQKLGALLEDGRITSIGRQMERMPVESHYARMMIEARKYGPEVQAQLAAMLAIEEADGILQHKKGYEMGTEGWRKFVGPENDSDMIKQLEVYIATREMSDKQRRESNVFGKAYSTAKNIEWQLRRSERLHTEDGLVPPTPEQRKQLVECIVAGMVDNLYLRDELGYRDARGETRECGNRSLIKPQKLIVGTPFDLGITTRRGPRTLHLIESGTNVPSIDVLKKVAPQLFSQKMTGMSLDDGGVPVEVWAQVFNGQDTGETKQVVAAPSLERTRLIIGHVAAREAKYGVYATLNAQVAELNAKSLGEIPAVTAQDTAAMLEVALPHDIASVNDAVDYLPPVELTDLVTAEEQREITASSPDTYHDMNIRYIDGNPTVGYLSPDQLIELSDDALELPDGRAILAQESMYYTHRNIALAELRRRAQEAHAAEANRREEQARIAAERERVEAETQRQRQLLDERSNTMASETYPEDIEEISDDLANRMVILRGEIMRVPIDYSYDPGAGSRALDIYAAKLSRLNEEIASWRRANTASGVDSDMLTRLAARFNN